MSGYQRRLAIGSAINYYKEASEEKVSIESYKKEYADYWKEIIGVDGDFDLKAEKEEVE